MSKVIHLNESDFNATIQNSSKSVLVDFSASWCGPCKMLSPMLDKLADSSEEKAVICKVDIDESPEIAERYGIRSVPTLVLFNNGVETNRKIGLLSQNQLNELLK